MSIRVAGLACVLLLVSGLVVADVVAACHEERACHRVAEKVSHCEEVLPVLSACCLDQPGSVDLAIRSPQSPVQKHDASSVRAVVAESTPVLPTRSEPVAPPSLATPSPPLYRIHAALLL